MSVALGHYDGEKADVPKKLRARGGVNVRSRAMAYYRQRLDGETDSEIAAYWGRCRQYINKQINRLTAEQMATVRRERLRNIHADNLLREEELALELDSAHAG